MRVLMLVLLMAAPVLAGPTTRRTDVAPKDPPVVTYIGQASDENRLAQTPAFLQREGVSELQSVRDWAIAHTMPPAPCLNSYPPACGYGWTANHGFYR